MTSLGTVLKVSGRKHVITIQAPDISMKTTITGMLFYKHSPTTLEVTVDMSPPISEMRDMAMTLACVGKTSLMNT
jgi:hypothetical protein